MPEVSGGTAKEPSGASCSVWISKGLDPMTKIDGPQSGVGTNNVGNGVLVCMNGNPHADVPTKMLSVRTNSATLRHAEFLVQTFEE